MQTNEFNNLMDCKPADFLQELAVDQLDMESDVPINKQIADQIEENKVPIPEPLYTEIQTFITMLKGLDIKDAEIRRRVKIRFKIQVVN